MCDNRTSLPKLIINNVIKRLLSLINFITRLLLLRLLAYDDSQISSSTTLRSRKRLLIGLTKYQINFLIYEMSRKHFECLAFEASKRFIFPCVEMAERETKDEKKLFNIKQRLVCVYETHKSI